LKAFSLLGFSANVPSALNGKMATGFVNLSKILTLPSFSLCVTF